MSLKANEEAERQIVVVPDVEKIRTAAKGSRDGESPRLDPNE